MELLLNDNLELLENNKLADIDGGIMIGGIWFSGMVALKVFGAGVTLGGLAATTYYANKK